MQKLIDGPNPNHTTNWDEIWLNRAKKKMRAFDKYRFLAMIKWLPLDGTWNGRFLDFCCGAAELIQFVQNHVHHEAKMSGWDISKWAMETMAFYNPKAYWNNITIENVLDDTYKRLVPKGHPTSFNHVTCGETLEHMDDPEDLVRAVSKLTMTGGVMAFSTPARDINSSYHVWLIHENDLQGWLEKVCTDVEVECVGNYWIARGRKK